MAIFIISPPESNDYIECITKTDKIHQKGGSPVKIRENFNHTVYASFLGYVVQAIINNFAPLLFLTFQTSYSISLDMIALLVTINFGIQLLVDCFHSALVGF